MGKYQPQTQTERRTPLPLVFRVERSAISPGKPVVLMVGMHLTKTRGGITTLTAGILNSAIKEDYDFIYLASQAEDFGRMRKALLALTATLQFVRVCVFKRPELVYVHVGSNASLYRESAFILLAKVFRKRVLTHFHAGDFEIYFANQSGVGRKFIIFALGLSDGVIAVSQESARQLSQANPELKISIIPNAIDVSVLSDKPEPEKPRKDGTVRLLFVGAVGKLKGENDLIEALAILKDKGLGIKVSMVGYGAESLRTSCERLGVSDSIEHLGPVAMNERQAFYEQADIFVLPTYAEAMPISVIEAMAASLAIVTTPVGGNPELIDDGVEGMLVPSGNVEALAEKIEYLVRSPEIRFKMGKRAQKRCREQMDFGVYIERLGTEIGLLTGQNN